MKKLKVLIVDDSAYMRKRLSEIFLADPDFEGIRTATDGHHALKKIVEERPDVITLDLEMPGLDGIETLDYIMSEYPTPVVIVSAFTEGEREKTFEALGHGAVDYVVKPSGEVSMDMELIEDQLKAKVKQASKVDIKNFIPKVFAPKFIKKEYEKEGKVEPKDFKKLVIIGASTGGPPALEIVLSKLPSDLNACILVIQHMPGVFTNSFAGRLSRMCQLPVCEARAKDVLTAGNVFVAPGGFHMVIAENEMHGNKKGIINLTQEPAVFGIRPTVDKAMESAACIYGSDVIGIVLTGMGSDATEGLTMIKSKGGMTIAQDEESCAIFGMPKSAINAGVIDKVLPLKKIAGEIVDMVNTE